MALARINSLLIRAAAPSAEAVARGVGRINSAAIASLQPSDGFSRKVYCILGMPIDAIEMPDVLHRIDTAALCTAPFLLSTPNLNFLVTSRSEPEFRESLLDSDLCPPDGAPIVWIARLIGVPIKTRVSGSDIFEALRAPGRCVRRL